MEKKVFKICEAVQLGLDYYYMGPKDRRRVTEDERKKARKIIQTLPSGWMQEKYDWQVFGKKKKDRMVLLTGDKVDGGYIMSRKEAKRLFPILKKKMSENIDCNTIIM